MKKIIVYLLILIPLISFSQNWQIPEIDWEGKTETENNYVDLLKLKDRNSLIIKIGYSSFWTKGTNSEFIVFKNNGKVKKFVVYQPNSIENKTKIKRKRIKKKDYKYYWECLNNCVQENKFQINKSKLNITEKERKTIENGIEIVTVERNSINDGTNYHFQICQGKNYKAYGSYAPTIYIENKYPGYEEREKLIDLMNKFEELTKKY
tara:strand:- start:455 stop:1075 length:621 start_codon:yes stop_codon:yes gene_type:complete